MSRIYYKKLTLVLILVLALFFTLKYLETQNSSQQKHRESLEKFRKEMQIISIDADEPKKVNAAAARFAGEGFRSNNPALSSLVDYEKCPMCFGTDICLDVRNGLLEGDMSHIKLVHSKTYKIIEEGMWKSKEPVVVKTLKPELFGALEEYICRNASKEIGCNAAQAVKDTFITSAAALSQDNIRDIYKVVKSKRNDIPISICATDKLTALLQKAFDENGDGILSTDEKTMLYTTFALNPEALVLKFLNKANLNLPFPKYYGACGRIAVIEGGLLPLKEYLKEPFEVRVSLANQILQMVDDFMEDDPEWALMFTDFSYDNLALNKDGEVVIMDVEDMVIMDRAALHTEYAVLPDGPGEPCNVKCFQDLTQAILGNSRTKTSGDEGSNTNVCQQLLKASHLMYAIVCQRILSYLDEHRVENYFSSQPNTIKKKAEYPGLLHSPPDHDHVTLKELLKECVQETAEGGRAQAAEELREYLNEIAAGETEKKQEKEQARKENDEDPNMLLDYIHHEEKDREV